MKTLIIFFLRKKRDWYNLKIGEYQAYLRNLNLLADYVGVDFEYTYTEAPLLENQLEKYKMKRQKVSEKIKKLKQR